MVTDELTLEATRFESLSRWYWRLTDAESTFLADHEVAFKETVPEFEGFCDLPHYLTYHADPGRLEEGRAWLLSAFGDWLAVGAFGTIAEKLIRRAPVTVRVAVPAAGAALALRPFEAARVEGRTLAEAGITLVFVVAGDPDKPMYQEMGDRLRMLAVFSLPPMGSPLNLREERQALRKLVQDLAAQRQAMRCCS